jgi:formylmethanofuran dehydrogenase subunit E
MKKLVRKLAILGILAFGLFFVAFDSPTQTSAAGILNPSCQSCIEMQSDCNMRCENGEIGCTWCQRKVAQCFSICRW